MTLEHNSELTDSDVVESVEWFVSCSDCHSYSVFSLTAIKRLGDREFEIVLDTIVLKHQMAHSV